MDIDLANEANWDLPLFPVSLAAIIGGVEGGTLRAWFQRGEFPMWDADKPADRNGAARRLTFRTVLHLATSARLWAKGVNVRDAYEAVLPWLHVWDAKTATHLVNGLFPDPDWTVLVHFTGGCSKIARGKAGELLSFEYEDLQAFDSPGPTIIFLNPVLHTALKACREHIRSGVRS